MPLYTEIVREGKPLPIPWGGFHVTAMVLASYNEDQPDDFEHPVNATVMITAGDVWKLMDYTVIGATKVGREGSHTIARRYDFWDISDNEIFTLLPGDELKAWRMHN